MGSFPETTVPFSFFFFFLDYSFPTAIAVNDVRKKLNRYRMVSYVLNFSADTCYQRSKTFPAFTSGLMSFSLAKGGGYSYHL